ncbi:MAG: oxygenase MpaB family protein [Acidimicrobiales bacterium]
MSASQELELGSEVRALAAALLTVPVRVPVAFGVRLLAPARAELRRQVRRSLGMPRNPPRPAQDDADSFLPADAVARRVHGDLPSMVIGGLAALLLQSLHPLAMAGVADHSNYKDDAIGRLRRTASFIAATTFGSVDRAEAAIDEVRQVHRHVHGRAPDGRRYSANDPDLLTWVHVAEVHCFLAASQRYGPQRLTRPTQDRYFAETAGVARALGARAVPVTRDEVDAYFECVQPELHAGRQALDARDFLLRGVATRPVDRLLYASIVAGALSIVPRWARSELGIDAHPLADDLVVAPAGRSLCAVLRWGLRP